MIRVIASMLLWGSALAQDGSKCVRCGREISEYSILAVETRKPHNLKLGQRVHMRSLDRTPHGKLLVEVIP